VEVVLGSRDREIGGQVNAVQPGKVDIAAVDDVDRAGLYAQVIQDPDVVNFAGGDHDHAGNVKYIPDNLQKYRKNERRRFAVIAPNRRFGFFGDR
jgi:hypothetical protein